MNEFMIAPMTEKDIAAVYAIECESFSVPWSRDSFRELLGNPSAAFFCALDSNGVAGYAGLYFVRGDETYAASAEIMNIAVRKDRRRQGIAAALLSRLEQFAAGQGADLLMLEVRRSNEPARALYRLFGYTESGVRRGYYTHPTEDAILMNKYI